MTAEGASGFTYTTGGPDVFTWLKQKIAEDEKFISDHHGYCCEYPQNARVEFIGELLQKYEHWSDKAESWDYREDYCNERANFLDSLLRLIAQNWEDLF